MLHKTGIIHNALDTTDNANPWTPNYSPRAEAVAQEAEEHEEPLDGRQTHLMELRRVTAEHAQYRRTRRTTLGVAGGSKFAA